MKSKLILPILFAILYSCADSNLEHQVLSSSVSSAITKNHSENTLDPKWYEGKAEIGVYELKQNRYNATHNGEAVMIFVTEDFLSDKQVKNDNYTHKNSIPILKNNQIRRFTTGLYDYSIFTSVFSKNKSDPSAIKITTSSQDWCGQSYIQLNERSGYFQCRGFSYFENEGDSDQNIKKHITMDEIFNLIRIDDSKLPVGDFKIIPSTIYHRLRHKALKPYSAKAIKIDYQGDLTQESATKYVIKIPELSLEYEYVYTNNKLRPILQWKESYPSAFDGKVRSTVATLKHMEWSDYWSKNGKSDETLRKDFKLNGF